MNLHRSAGATSFNYCQSCRQRVHSVLASGRGGALATNRSTKACDAARIEIFMLDRYQPLALLISKDNFAYCPLRHDVTSNNGAFVTMDLHAGAGMANGKSSMDLR